MNSEENFYHNRLPENDQMTNMNSGNNGNMNYNNSNSSSNSNSNSNGRGDRDYDPSGRNYNNNNNSNNSNNNNPAPHSMVGIGNPHFNASNTEKTWMQIAREKASNVGANVSAGAIGLSNGSSNPTKWLSNISTQRYKQSADDGRGSNLISSTSNGGEGNKMNGEEGQYTTQGIGNNSSSSSSSSSNGVNYSNKYAHNSSSAYTPYSSGTAPSYALSSSPSSSSSSSSAFVRRSTADMNNLNNRQFESSSGPESYGIPGQTTTFGLSSGSTPTGAGGLIKPMVSAIGKGGSAASDGEYERALVTSLCEPGGLKAVPTESSINTFHQKIVNLSANLIGDSLVEQFNSDHWQSRNKALSVVESFCNPIGQNGEICTGLDDHVAWWRTVESMCTLQSMTSDSKASVRSQALKTLNAIVLYKSATPTSSSLSSSPISVTANHTGSTGGSAVDNGYTNNQPVSLLDNDSYSSTSVVEEEVEVEVEVLIEESLINMEDLEPQIPVFSNNQQQQQRNVSLVNQQKSSYQNNQAQPNEDFLQKERDEIALLLDMDDEYNERKNMTSNININNDYSKTVKYMQNLQSINTVEEISIFGQMTVNKQQNNSNITLNNSHNAHAGMMPAPNHDYGILDLADSVNNNNSKSVVSNNQYDKKNIEIDMFAGLNLSSKPLVDNHNLQQSFSSTSKPSPLPPSSSSSSSSSFSCTVPGSNPLPSSSFNTLLNPTDNFAFLSSNIPQSQSQSQSQSQLLSYSHSQFSQPLISTLQTPSNQILNTTNNISSHSTNTYNTMNGITTGFGLTPLSPLNTPRSYTNTNIQHNTQHNTQYTSTSPSSTSDTMPIFSSTTTGLNLNNGTKPLQVPFFLQSNSGTTVTSSSLGINGINKVQDSSHSFIPNKNNMNVMNKNYDSVGLNNCNLGLNNGNNGNFNSNNGQYFIQQNQNQQGDDRMQNTTTNSNRMSGHINGTPGMMNTVKISRDTQNAISTSFSTSTSPSTSTQPTLKDDSFSFLSDVLKNPNSVPVPQTRK